MTRLFTYADMKKPFPEGFGIPEEMAREAVACGELKAIRQGTNFVRMREEDVDAWLKGRAKTQ